MTDVFPGVGADWADPERDWWQPDRGLDECLLQGTHQIAPAAPDSGPN